MKNMVLVLMISVCMSVAVTAAEREASRYNNDSNRGGSTRSDWNNRSYQGNRNDSYNRNDSHHGDNRGYSGNHYSSQRYNGGSSTVIYVTQRVWVPGCTQRVWVPARYEYVRQSCGTLVRVCVSEGYYSIVQGPGYYTYRQVPVYGTGGHCPSGSSVSVSWRW